MAFDKVDGRNTYLCTGNPLPEDMEQIANWLFNESFVDCFDSKALH